ncbi:MAG: cobalt-zinc-cadmium efflux system outer membrane protein [Cyclobacteriaceae bacterium]
MENDLVSQFENLKYNVSRENELLAFYQIQMGETEQIQSLMLSAFSNSGKDLDELLRIQMQLLNYQTKKIKSQTRLKILAENLDYLLAGISN